MSSTPNYASTARLSAAYVGIGDTSRVHPVNVSTVFTAGASGSRIDNIDIIGTGTTGNTQVRLWKYDGTNYHLFYEATMAATTPSATVPVAMSRVTATDNSTIMPIQLPNGYSLRASVNDTQTGASLASVATVCASQAVSSGVGANLNGSLATAASTTSIAAAATLGAAGYMTLTSAVVTLTTPALVTLTSTGNISGVNFTITGTNAQGAIISETIAGPNNNTVTTTNPFVSVAAIYANGAVGTNTSAGNAAAVAMTVPCKAIIMSTVNLAGVNFTITGILQSGATTTEVLTGPAAGSVATTVNTYRSVIRVVPNGAVTEMRIGTDVMPFGFAVIARGGDY